jgi:hypothetical protein
VGEWHWRVTRLNIDEALQSMTEGGRQETGRSEEARPT